MRNLYISLFYLSLLTSGFFSAFANTKPAYIATVYPLKEDPIEIMAQSNSRVACNGESVFLFVEARTECGVQYQWYKNGTPIDGADASSYEFTATENNVEYHAVIKGECGEVESDKIIITTSPFISNQPQAATVCSGNSHTFSVTATNATAYQWYKGENIIVGATNASYTINNVSQDDAGNYSVRISGNADCSTATINSSVVALTVNTTASIAAQSESQTACEGDEVNIFVETIGTVNSLLWYKNGASTGLTSNSIEVTPANGDVYYAQINGACNSPKSNDITFTLNLKPVISAQPQSASACAGSNHTFSVTATNATAYQWYKGENIIAGATSASYTINSVSQDDADNYYVRISGNADCPTATINSSVVALTVNTTASIAAQSESQTICEGDPVSIFVETTGTVNSLIWYKNGSSTGLTSNSIEVTPANGDVYYAQINGACNSPKSSDITFTLNLKPVISAQPQNASACAGSNHTFSVTATNATAYQWYKGENIIAGATNASFTINNVSQDDAGNYSVRISGNADCPTATINSSVVALTVNTTASIAAQSESQTICEGDEVSIFVETTGTVNSLLWYKNGSSTGLTSNSIDVTPANGDVYYAQINGACNSPKSNDITFTLNLKPVISAQPQNASACVGSNHTFSVTSTNATAYQWYKGENIIAGATSASFTINNVSQDDAGNYSVRISGNADCPTATINSSVVALTVNTTAAIAAQSESQTICEGDPVSIFVETTGTVNSLLWYKNSSSTGLTSNSIEVTPANGDVYYAQINGACNSPKSSDITFTVNLKPAINSQPQAATVCSGNSHIFSVTATNATAYQWFKGENIIAGATNASYTINSVSQDDAGNYSVRIAGNADCPTATINSSVVALTVNTTASIAAQSESQTICEGDEVSIFVETTGTVNSLLWYKNGSSTGLTSNSIEVTPSNGDVYYAQINGACNSPKSSDVTFTLNLKPAINSQPQAATVCSGNSHTFSVTASNATAYQWYKGENIIAGATSASYTINSVSQDDAGNYSVRISGNADCPTATINSSVVALTVNTTASIAAQSESQTICEGDEVNIFVETTGTVNSLLWYKNGSSTGLISNSIEVTPANGDVYYAQINGACNSPKSSDITFTVNLKPAINSQPQAATVCSGNSHTFSVTASNATAYQWYKGENIIAGATNASYTINNVSQDDAGNYSVRISGNADCPTATTNSSVVALTVNTTAAIAGQSESQTICEGDPVSIFVETTGTVNSLLWYKNGASTGLTSNSIEVTPANGDVYYAQINGACNSPKSNDIVFTLTANIVLTASSNKPGGICKEEQATLTASGCSTEVNWYKDDALVGTGTTYSTSQEGNYKASCMNQTCNKLVFSDIVSVSHVPEINYTVYQADISCFGGSDGSATVIFPEGSNYTVTWLSPFTHTGNSINNVTAGTYSFKVSNSSGCEKYGSVTITQPEYTTASYTTSNATCFGKSDGRITITTYPDKSDLNYYLNGAISTWPNGTIEGLAAGVYTIHATDSKGCIILSPTQIVLTSPSALETKLVSFTEPKSFNSADGSIIAEVSGGTDSYSVLWTDTQGNIFTENVNNVYTDQGYRTQLSMVKGNAYELKVWDNNGCHVVLQTELPAPKPILITSTIDSVGCYGSENGKITLSVTGGVKTASEIGYLIEWRNTDGVVGTNSLQSPGLKAGEYQVTITDANGISVMEKFTLLNPPLLAMSATKTIDSYCASSLQGEINLQVSGGRAPYAITFNNNPVHELTMKGLGAGIYTASVTDVSGCIASAVATVADSTKNYKAIVNYTAPSCFGACNGSLIAEISGGITPYTLSWSNSSQTTTTLSNICAGGESFVLVTDARGCLLKSESVSLTGPPPVALSLPTEIEVCPTKTFEMDATSISWGTDFLWTFPDGTKVSGGKVPADSLGTYHVQVLNERSCGGTGTIRVIPIKNITVRFTMPDAAPVNKEIVIIDLSDPFPSNIEWQLPVSGRIITQKEFEARISFSEVGNYVVRQLTTIDNCVYTYSKGILISETLDDDGFTPAQGYTHIDFTVMGNPVTTDNFRIKIDNDGRKPFTIKVFSLSGSQKVYEQDFEADTPDFVNLKLPDSGLGTTFYVTLESGNIRRTRKVIFIK